MDTWTLFYRCAQGCEAQSVDAWYLVVEDDQESWVHHSWSHREETGRPDIGYETFTAARLMATIDDQTVLACFRAALKNNIRAHY